LAKESVLVRGLPISKVWKWKLVLIFFLLIIINHNLATVSTSLDYPFRDWVSLVLLVCFVLFSIGSIAAESLVIGLAIFAIMSSIWDFSVVDISELRRKVLIGSFIVLISALAFGKVSFFNLIGIVRQQLGSRIKR